MINSDSKLWLKYKVLYPAISQLPKNLSYRAAKAIGRRNFRVEESYQQSVKKGLRCFFPAMQEQELDIQSRKHMEMLAKEPLDVFRIPKMNLQTIDSNIEVTGLSNLQQALETDRPVMLYSAHYGRMIMPSIAIGLRGYHAACLVADLTGEHIPEIERNYRVWKMAQVQSKTKGAVIQRHENLRKLYRVLDRKELLAVTLDTPRTRFDKVTEFPLFGGIAKFPNGVLRVAKKKGALMVPYFSIERGISLRGDYLPAIDIQDMNDVDSFLALYEPIEKYIKRNPSQWWMWSALDCFWRS